MDYFKAFDTIHRGKMVQILFAYRLSKEIIVALVIVYKNTKVKVRSLDGDAYFFEIVDGVL